MNLAEVLLNAMKDIGTKEIFGIPGDFALPFFKVIEESGILPVYTVSHEPSVGFAADAASRCHKAPSVAAITYGAGGFNMLNPIAAAYVEKVPVIVISGGPGKGDKATGLLVHHQAKTLNSQLQVYKEVTCDQVILGNAKDAPAQIARVLSNCIKHSRPVYIEIPTDQVFETCDPVDLKSIDTQILSDKNELRTSVDKTVEQLKNALSPVLIVGIEIRRYSIEKQIASLANHLGIPVVTTLMGRGLLSHEDVEVMGTYMGIAGDPEIKELVENSDAPIYLGTILSDGNFGVAEKKIDFQKVIVASDHQVSMDNHVYHDVSLKDFVEELHRCSEQHPQTKLLPSIKPDYPRNLCIDELPVTPTDIAKAINDLFEETGQMPIASDMGDCFFTSLDIDCTDIAANAFYASMGYGVPASFGIQAATGKRPIVLVGDGAFQMTGWELLNTVKYGWNPIVIVLNNSSWEMMRTLQPEAEFSDLPELNYAMLGNELGGRGHRVTSKEQLKQALKDAWDDKGSFQLIDVIINKEVLSNKLIGFITGITKMRAQASA
ncbi:MAG: indolepyruvate/phenylpyruvate decarboxylase [Gammaproteobacteria bacterium]|nr:MAG: indolepyruvate/phenylpyruvate decarboxylase [Gammaproteobacteria bacterium]